MAWSCTWCGHNDHIGLVCPWRAEILGGGTFRPCLNCGAERAHFHMCGDCLAVREFMGREVSRKHLPRVAAACISVGLRALSSQKP